MTLEWRVRARAAVDGGEYDDEYCAIIVVRDGEIQTVREYLDSAYAARVLFHE